MPRAPAEVPLSELRDVAATLAGEFALDLVILFGSAARRDGGWIEDLDIGVLARHPLDMVALTNAWTTRLGVQAVDLTELRRGDWLLLAVVAQDGIVLHEREPGAFDRFVTYATRRFMDSAKLRDAERDALRETIRQLVGTVHDGAGDAREQTP